MYTTENRMIGNTNITSQLLFSFFFFHSHRDLCLRSVVCTSQDILPECLSVLLTEKQKPLNGIILLKSKAVRTSTLQQHSWITSWGI